MFVGSERIVIGFLFIFIFIGRAFLSKIVVDTEDIVGFVNGIPHNPWKVRDDVFNSYRFRYLPNTNCIYVRKINKSFNYTYTHSNTTVFNEYKFPKNTYILKELKFKIFRPLKINV